MKNYAMRRFALAGLICGSAAFATPASGSGNGPDAAYQDFAPTEDVVLTRDSHIPVKATVSYFAAEAEPVKFFTQFSVNGGRYTPSTVELTQAPPPPGQLTSKEEIATTVYVPSQRHLFLRMHIWGVGETTHHVYEFYDVTRKYVVVASKSDDWWARGFLRFFGLCS